MDGLGFTLCERYIFNLLRLIFLYHISLVFNVTEGNGGEKKPTYVTRAIISRAASVYLSTVDISCIDKIITQAAGKQSSFLNILSGLCILVY